jgi:riboflavin biosynthesis pyrimidine reductase
MSQRSDPHAATDAPLPGGSPLEVLFEQPNLPEFDLPVGLRAAYAGNIGFERPRVVANFVASVDGVVALPEGTESGKIVSLNNEADRFVMGLLRSCADAIVIGAGTFRKATKDVWSADAIYPEGAPLFASLRTARGLPPHPRLVIVSASGDIDVTGPAIPEALFVTNPTGARMLRPRVPTTTELFVVDRDEIRLAEVISHLQATGAGLVLTEGGPTLVARLIAEQVLDELFITSSPALFGRFRNDGRKSLTDGVDLSRVPLELSSVRRHGSHLFLRYALPRSGRG